MARHCRVYRGAGQISEGDASGPGGEVPPEGNIGVGSLGEIIQLGHHLVRQQLQ